MAGLGGRDSGGRSSPVAGIVATGRQGPGVGRALVTRSRGLVAGQWSSDDGGLQARTCRPDDDGGLQARGQLRTGGRATDKGGT
jgi:hypothetical protein